MDSTSSPHGLFHDNLDTTDFSSFSLEHAPSNCVVSQQGAAVNPLFKGLLPVVISLGDKGQPENWGSVCFLCVSSHVEIELTALQVPLGFARLEDWSPEKIIFTFGVLGIDAHLSPQFDTRQLGKGVKKVHTILTFFGHTVMTEANIGTEHEAKTEACLRALRKLQNQHHWWTVPPIPTGQAVENERDWKKLLAGERKATRYSLTSRSTLLTCSRVLRRARARPARVRSSG